jgi:hypothetical protein
MDAGERPEAPILGRAGGLAEHLPAEVAASDLPYLAGLHHLVQDRESFRDRDGRVGKVDLVDIDVVGAEPAEAVLKGHPRPTGTVAAPGVVAVRM